MLPSGFESPGVYHRQHRLRKSRLSPRARARQRGAAALDLPAPPRGLWQFGRIGQGLCERLYDWGTFALGQTRLYCVSGRMAIVLFAESSVFRDTARAF